MTVVAPIDRVPQFLRFAAAGGIAALANVGSRMALSTAMPFEAAVAGAYLIGMTVAFLLMRRFVFGASERAMLSEYTRFAVVNAAAFAMVWSVSVGLARLIFPAIGFAWHAETIAHVIGVASPILPSFWGHRAFTFRRDRSRDPAAGSSGGHMTSTSITRRALMPRQILAWLPSAFALGAALVMALLLVRMLVVLHSALPFWDQFNVATPRQILDTLFERHNEHLIVLPRLGFLLDLTLTQGYNALNIATILLIQVAHALLLAWVVAVAQGRRIDPLALGVAFCFAVSAVQFENLSWGFQTQFVGVFAFATACFATLLLGGVGVRTTAASCLFGAAAALTMANGVLVLPIAALLALLAGRPRRQVVLLILATLILGAAYAATHVEVPHHGSPSAALRQPLRIVTFVAVYFGAPIAESLRVASAAPWRFPLAILFGSVGLLVASLLALRALRQRLRISPAEWVLFGVIVFTVVSAAATAAGRLAFGFEQATASRYATPVLLFWCCLLLWSYLLLLRHGARLARVVPGMLAGLTIVVASQQPRFLRDMEAYILVRYGAETALLSGADDEDAFRRVYAHTDIIRREGEALRAQRLSIFAPPYATWMGRPLEEALRVVPTDRCRGMIERADVQDTGPLPFATAAGWAWNTGDRSLIRYVILVDEGGRIVGIGRGPLRRRDLTRSMGHSIPDERIGWAGHAVVGPRATLRAFGLIGPDAACPLQGTVALLPASRPANR